MLHKPYGNLDEVKLIDCSGCEGEAEDLSKTSNLNIGDCPYVCNTCGGEPCQGYCTSDNKCVDKVSTIEFKLHQMWKRYF